MMDWSKFIRTATGRYILSILLGLGLATLFRKICTGRGCITYEAPPLEDINDKEYKFDDKCYKYTHSAVSCDKGGANAKIVDFA
jgi:hypothetical protein